MHRAWRRLALLGGLLLPGSLPAAAPPTRADLAARAHAVLRTHCAGCHAGGSKARSQGGLDYMLDRDRLVGRGQVVPGKSDDSPLFQRVRDGEMPPPRKGTHPVFTAADGAVLKRWI